MFTGYILLAIIIFIIYCVVWRGECRFACQPEMFDDGGVAGRSGITGLSRRRSHPHADCVCDHCPCRVVGEIVKSFRPIVQVYNTTAEAATKYYSDFSHILQNAGDRLARLLDCTISCDRQAQLVTTGAIFDPNEDFTLVAKPEVESKIDLPLMSTVSGASKYGAELVATISEIALKLSTSLDPDFGKVPVSHSELKAASSSGKTTLSPDKPSTSPKTFLESIDELPKREQKYERKRNTYKEHKIEKNKEDETRYKSVATETTQLDETLTETPLSNSITSLTNCSKCVAEGKTCIGGCPGAKRKQDNYNRK